MVSSVLSCIRDCIRKNNDFFANTIAFLGFVRAKGYPHASNIIGSLPGNGTVGLLLSSTPNSPHGHPTPSSQTDLQAIPNTAILSPHPEN